MMGMYCYYGYTFSLSGEPAQRCEIFRGNCIYAYFIAIDTLTNNFTDVHVEFTCEL